MPENTKARLKIIEEIEEIRGSKLITYFCGDRPGAVSGVGSDAIRPMFDHLKAIGHVEKIDLYLYGLGGVMEVPWRMVTMIRTFCESFSVIIPYKAYSAHSLISLGADNCLMGEKGELSPIDPQMVLTNLSRFDDVNMPSIIGVEDVFAYLRFIKEKAGLTDQVALSQQVAILTEKLTPVVLGKVQRAYSHIRLVARKLLSLQKPALEEISVSAIIDALTEKIYIHGHGIGRIEAKEIGLPVIKPDKVLEDKIWSLYLNYEESMGLLSTPDLAVFLQEDETMIYCEDKLDTAYIESTEMAHAFRGKLEIKMIRNIPESPEINLNVVLQFPPDIDMQSLPENVTQILGQLMQNLRPQINEQIETELARQSPMVGVASRHRYVKWEKIR